MPNVPQLAADDKFLPAAEFQSLPLESIIAAPLRGAVEAQAIAAAATKAFLESMIDNDGNPITVKFKVAKNGVVGGGGVAGAGGQQGQTTTIEAPLLAMVPVPHLRIDSLTSTFKYEISSVQSQEATKNAVFGGNAGTVGLLSKFVSISLNGSVSSSSRESSSMNRSGSLELTVHASESPMPEGLASLLSILSKSIEAS
jgi:hypothetical protein